MRHLILILIGSALAFDMYLKECPVLCVLAAMIPVIALWEAAVSAHSSPGREKSSAPAPKAGRAGLPKRPCSMAAEILARNIEAGDMDAAFSTLYVVKKGDAAEDDLKSLFFYALKKDMRREMRILLHLGADPEAWLAPACMPSWLRSMLEGIREEGRRKKAPRERVIPETWVNSWLSLCTEKNLLGAAAKGDRDTVNTCLDFGIDINTRDDRGRTPLMLAAAAGHFNVVRHLLIHGYSIYMRKDDDAAQNIGRKIALQRSASELGLSAESGVNLRDSKGLTALGLARRNGHAKVAAVLEEYGALC